MSQNSPTPLFQRLTELDREPVSFSLDGKIIQALAGDTLLTAILTHEQHLRGSDFNAEPRAGFCLMGACQDCWVRVGSGKRVRACSTFVEPGVSVSRDPGRSA